MVKHLLFSPLIAFGFSTPWMLFGLVLGSIPIIIHLLHKRSYRETNWAAMHFLLAALKRNSRRIRLEQILLLMVRTLIMMFVVLAFAQPFFESTDSKFTGDVPRHHLLVIDTSFSMGFPYQDGTRFQRAKAIASMIVEQSTQGDCFHLVQICEMLPRTIIAQSSYSKQQVLKEIDQLKLTHEAGDVKTSLQDTLNALEQEEQIPQKEVTILSDFQQGNWLPHGETDSIRSSLQSIAKRGKLTFIDLGDDNLENVAITHFETNAPFLAVNQALPFQATIRNFGQSSLTNQKLELYVDGRKRDEKQFDLGPRQEAVVDFQVTFPSTSQARVHQEHDLEVRLPDDLLPVDNHRWLAITVKQNIDVLLVNGKPGGSPREWGTHYLQHALAPSLPNQPWNGLIRPEVIDERKLNERDLTKYGVIFLCNVGIISSQDAQLLQSYVESGGSLVISLGDQVDLESYNLEFFRSGEGLLPAELFQFAGNSQAPQEEDIVVFDAESLEHPIVQVFQGNPGSGLETALTFQYVKVKPSENREAKTILKFAPTGDPALIEAPFGQGHVILCTTALDAKWSTWARENSSFAPLVHEMVKELVSGELSQRKLQVGEPLVKGFPIQAPLRSVDILRPDGTQDSLTYNDERGFVSLQYDKTNQQGIYRLILGHPLNRQKGFAVNLDTSESDLQTLSETEFDSDLLPNTSYQKLSNWREQSSDVRVPSSKGVLTRWLLYACLCLLLVEQVMAWKFSLGLMLLSGVIMLAFAMQSLRAGNLWVKLPLLVVILVALFALFQLRKPAGSKKKFR